jgi:hypothetical protein
MSFRLTLSNTALGIRIDRYRLLCIFSGRARMRTPGSFSKIRMTVRTEKPVSSATSATVKTGLSNEIGPQLYAQNA